MAARQRWMDNPWPSCRAIQVATRLALLPQYVEDVFPATVFDTVMIGRHPHIPRFQWESERDRDIAEDSLRLVDLGDMPQRDIATLSGGERRRLGHRASADAVTRYLSAG